MDAVARLFDPSSVYSITLEGVPITFVHRVLNDDRCVYCAAVLSGLGYAHDACLDPDGHEHPIPAGAAHLLEHALTSTHLEEHGYPVIRRGTWSVQTAADRMTWGLTYAYANSDTPHDEVAAAVGHLLGMVVDPATESALEEQIRHEAGIIAVERAGRHSDLSYRLQIAMMGGLYPGVNLGSDPLGPEGFAATVTAADLAAALSVIQHDVRAITVVAPVTEALIESVLLRVERLCGLASRSRWIGLARHPLSRAPEPLRLVSSPSSRSASAHAAVGVRLPGLLESAADRRERARRFLLTEALPDRVAMQSSTTARTLASMATIDPPWLEASDAEELVTSHVETTRRTLRRITPPALEMGLLTLGETMSNVLRLAQRADIHNLTLADVFEVAETIDTASLGDVDSELRDARSTVAYCGPALG
jgi:hypothetical protein